MRVHDVVIVGAGPAGSALAAYLSRDGYSVLLLEKQRFPRDKVCGDLVSAKGLKLLAEIGCYAEIPSRGFAPIREAAAYLDGGLLTKSALPRVPDHPTFGHAIPRIELDELMFRAALAAGAEAQEGCTVEGHSVEGSLSAVEARVDGRRARFLGRVVVGADGAASVVARCAGLEMRDPRYVQLAMRAYCRGLPLDHAVLYFSEDFFPGYGWIFPVDATLANIGVGMVKAPAQRDGIVLRRFFARLVGFVRERARALGAHVEIGRPAGWPIKTYGGARRNFFDRGLLIGDAGCFVDPISGEGIPLAIESAGMAADTIREAFARNDFGAASLAAFERRWRARYDLDLGISDLLVSVIRNRDFVKLWIQWLRVMARTASSDPDYALKVGGILAGLVPNRASFAPDVVLKSLVHGPGFWLEALGASRGCPASGALARGVARGVELLSYEARTASSIAADPESFGGWLYEIGAKQSRVLGRLIAAGFAGQSVAPLRETSTK